MKLNKILLRKGYVKIKLKKINTNHFELKAKVNGVSGKFILEIQWVLQRIPLTWAG